MYTLKLHALGILCLLPTRTVLFDKMFKDLSLQKSLKFHFYEEMWKNKNVCRRLGYPMFLCYRRVSS